MAVFAEMVKAKTGRRRRCGPSGALKVLASRSWKKPSACRTAQSRPSPHQQAAQAVLKALLPPSGTDIKGQMRSAAELLEASATLIALATSTN